MTYVISVHHCHQRLTGLSSTARARGRDRGKGEMAAVAEEMLDFRAMTEAQLREWVEAHPGRVNDRDRIGFTPLRIAVSQFSSLPLVLWLIDEKGADVNGGSGFGVMPLRFACSFDMFTALLDRGADPTHSNKWNESVLMDNANYGRVDTPAAGPARPSRCQQSRFSGPHSSSLCLHTIKQK